MSYEDEVSHNGLDETDKKIIEQLQHDGRKSYATIAETVGLSEAATRQRVLKLKKSGVVQIVAVTDPVQLGFGRQALVGISVKGNVYPVVEALQQLEGVAYVVIASGRFDILAEVVAESDGKLLSLVNSEIRSHHDVVHTETLMYLELAMQKYNWGTR